MRLIWFPYIIIDFRSLLCSYQIVPVSPVSCPFDINFIGSWRNFLETASFDILNLALFLLYLFWSFGLFTVEVCLFLSFLCYKILGGFWEAGFQQSCWSWEEIPCSPFHQPLNWRGIEPFGWSIPPVEKSEVRILVVEHWFLEDSFGGVNCFLDFSVWSSMIRRLSDMLEIPFSSKCFEIWCGELGTIITSDDVGDTIMSGKPRF